MAFELGTTLGDYHLIDVLDSNREGTSYKVRNVSEQRFEILRVLSESTQSDPVRLERFQREAKILARLNHPHIVSYRSSTKLGGRYVLATELVECTNLAERLEVGPLSLPDAVKFIWQALDALECAHQGGVVHRDIHPGKLLITAESELKLSGFSLARSTADPRLTQAGVAIGSAHYMSPEQVQATGDLDARSDLYSLGVVFYELTAGRKPFEFDSQFDLMLAHVETAPEPPSKWNSQIPPELDAIILKSLAKNLSERFQSAGEFRNALLSISLGGIPEPAEDIEKALSEMKRRGREWNRQANALSAEILVHQGESLPRPPMPSTLYGMPRLLVIALMTIGAIGLFFLTNGLK
ncbi:serine/threonine protein kinase [Bryobacter aggregatus]|uniref:serine/threonine protein kinase n=1 Tax=Bryobacter aggregatus TaxID=360054 RepID=UPI00138DD4E7|nr:serine/threonine-protein kinase [Bryobacter aggregatus]